MEQQSAVIDWVDPNLLKPHKLSLRIYGEDSCEDLVESIKELGVIQPLYATPKGIIISGHRRWRAAQIAGKQVPVIRKSYPKPLDEQQAIIEFNRYRIKTGQQLYNEGKALEEILTRKRGRPKTEEKVEKFPPFDKTRDAIAEAIGLGSGKQWDKLEYVAGHQPELLPKITPSGMTIHRAYRMARQVEQRCNIQNVPPLPAGKFQVIYADPPWQYNNSGLEGSAESHYPTMSVDDLCRLDIDSLAADDSVLFLWATSPFLREGLRLCQAWGFEYKTTFVWIKDRSTYGKLGFYNYSQHEFLFVATKGSCLPQLGTLQPSVLYAPKTNHSEKPEKVYEYIEKMYLGPYVELFATKERKKWTPWGTL